MNIWRRLGWIVLAIYILTLTASNIWWATHPRPEVSLPDGKYAISLEQEEGPPLRMAYQRLSSPSTPDAPQAPPTLVLIHGSPGRSENFTPSSRNPGMARALAQHFQVLIPDLPGFGDSTIGAPDLSIQAHAGHLLSLLDQLEIPRAHLVGYSMGGGPALHLWERAPERVASITLLSSIGVQEMELLGDYTMNHALHSLQLTAFKLARILFPHFGATEWLDKAVAYARNFHETDQRPLRGLLEAFEPPMLILHGEADPLVSVGAAREHARIVPQSVLWVNDQSHFMVFESRPALLEPLVAFVEAVESGAALHRSEASAARLARAAEAFDPSSVPPATGPFLALLILLIALSTLVSEDLTCIGAGLMAANGQITWLAASAACLLGIFVGDIMLFLAGRLLGRPAVRRAPLKWFVTAAALERSQRWFDKRGPAVILLSRFMPGMRLPTYVAAGVLGTGLLKFCLWFLAAGLLWTPALVGLSMVAGGQILDAFGWMEEHPLLGVAAVIGTLMLVLKLAVPMLSHRGRRLLYGRWLRLTRWEFWPPWVFYPPVVAAIAWLGLKHRSLAVVTAVNPCMPAGGIIGESKTEILEHMRRCFGQAEATVRTVQLSNVLPFSTEICAELSAEERLARVHAFLSEHALDYPVVLKPDAGQRGSGVEIMHAAQDIPAALERLPVDLIAQEFVHGLEFGVFYARQPGEDGEVFSITEKITPTVTGDGTRSVEELLLDDARAPAMYKVYSALLGERLSDVPEVGETVRLTEIGAHACGTIFRDAHDLHTPQLAAAIDAISRPIKGFSFGRFDIMVRSKEHLQRGEGLRVIELNGLTSEATHIYDARTPLITAWRTLASQWARAFRIGAAHRAQGTPTTSMIALAGMTLGFLRSDRRRR